MPETINVHHSHIYAEVCTSACPANPWFEKRELGQELLRLVSDWQANGNSRPLGDPTADTWQDCARQLLDVVNANGAGL